MKAWQLGYICILIPVVFSSISLVFNWMGIPLFGDMGYSYSNGLDSAASNSLGMANDYDNSLSLFTLPIEFIKLALTILQNVLFANRDILVGLLHIPEGIWMIYAIIHYISIISMVLYLFTGKNVEQG